MNVKMVGYKRSLGVNPHYVHSNFSISGTFGMTKNETENKRNTYHKNCKNVYEKMVKIKYLDSIVLTIKINFFTYI